MLNFYASYIKHFRNIYTIYIYIYKCVYIEVLYLIVVNISFFDILMSLEVQSCVNLNGTNRKEGGTRQEKKSFTDRKTFEAIVYKYLGVISAST